MRILASPAFSNESINPYNALLYRELQILKSEVTEYSHFKNWFQKFSIVHFHWPDGYINQKSFLKSLQRIFVFSISLLIAKLKGSKIVWTVHNLEPHDAFHPVLSKKFMDWFAGHCDGFIFLNEETKETFVKIFPRYKNIDYSIIPHGHYRTAYKPGADSASAKKILNISKDQMVLLCIGMIKPYKNVDHLIKLFREINLDKWTLVIAGNPESKELAQSLEKMAFGYAKITLNFKFISNQEMSTYLSAADAVILPYKNILNSGALLLALSFNKPVMAPLAGAVKNLEAELGDEWIYGYSGDLTSIKLINFLTHIQSAEQNKICPLDNYNWDSIGQKTLAFYNHLIAPQKQEDQAICR